MGYLHRVGQELTSDGLFTQSRSRVLLSLVFLFTTCVRFYSFKMSISSWCNIGS